MFTDTAERLDRTCDLFGLSLSWELDSPILLDLLKKQNINIWSDLRTENDPIVFGGGPVLTANPEPLAPFLDVVLLGDGEELLPNFINSIKQLKDESRAYKLKMLAKIPGIYVPSLYQPEYSSDGTLLGVNPIFTDLPQSITKQTWNSNILGHSTVITPEAAWPNIHMVEVVRSCPEMCRFCMASYLTLPFRSPSLNDGLIQAVEKGLSATNRLGLLGASVTQHPEFLELLTWLNQDQFNDIQLSISSVRASSLNSRITKILAKRGSKSLTIAIESGSSKLRQVINKKLSEDEIFSAAKYTKEGGLKKLKLYGMVGLPTESDDDIEASAKLLIEIKKRTPGLHIVFGLSTFVPKAQTPFQWQGVRQESKQRIKFLHKMLKPKGIDLRAESYGWSTIQALFSRSDRRLAPVILAVRNSQNTLGGWKKAYKGVREDTIQTEKIPILLPKPPPWDEVIYSVWNETKILPWTHLNGPISELNLLKHQEIALNQNNE